MKKNYIRLDLDGLKYMFWGFLFILVDFRINGLDILPNIVGYIIIIIGLSKISKESPHFQRAIPYSVVGIALCVIDFFTIAGMGGSLPSGYLGDPTFVWIWVTVIGVVNLVSTISLYNHTIEGIKEIAYEYNEFPFAELGNKVFLWVLANQVFAAFNYLTGSLFYSSVFMLFLNLILSILAAIKFLAYLNRTHGLLHERLHPLSDNPLNYNGNDI